MTEKEKQRLRELVRKSLEAVRAEVARRLLAKNLPLSITIKQTTVHRLGSGHWQSTQEDVQVGNLDLYKEHVSMFMTKEAISHQLHGFREQLQELANYLNDSTELARRSSSIRPTETGIDTILRCYVRPMAHHYLNSLTDLAADDQKMIARLTGELKALIDQNVIHSTSQIALGGIVPSANYSHRDVTLRPLSPWECGAFYDRGSFNDGNRSLPGSDLVVPPSFTQTMLSALLEVTTRRPFEQQIVLPTLPNRMVLALFLSDFDVSGSGRILNFDRPIWATRISHGPFPLTDQQIAAEKPISQSDFSNVVDLAYKIPKFGGAEESSREIVLSRVLRGCGMRWGESGFLDFAIALEAALLGSPTTELRYKFSLYGALFLEDQFDPRHTFERLKKIYDVRSKLVHGGRVKPQDLQVATQHAIELAKAVTRKAVQSGWPDATMLDAAALRTVRQRVKTRE